jgi:hypothetical protein
MLLLEKLELQLFLLFFIKLLKLLLQRKERMVSDGGQRQSTVPSGAMHKL